MGIFKQKFMSVDDAAKFLEVHKSRISQLISKGELKRFIKRGRVYVLTEQVEAYDTIRESHSVGS